MGCCVSGGLLVLGWFGSVLVWFWFGLVWVGFGLPFFGGWEGGFVLTRFA